MKAADLKVTIATKPPSSIASLPLTTIREVHRRLTEIFQEIQTDAVMDPKGAEQKAMYYLEVCNQYGQTVVQHAEAVRYSDFTWFAATRNPLGYITADNIGIKFDPNCQYEIVYEWEPNMNPPRISRIGVREIRPKRTSLTGGSTIYSDQIVPLIADLASHVDYDLRPSFDQLFMAIAELLRTRGTCPKLKVGAVLVKDNQILATGYNGAPRGLPDCYEVGCLTEEEECFICRGTGRIPSDSGIVESYEDAHCNGTGKIPGKRCKRTVHAEQNCLIQAGRNGVSTIGATLYTTYSPCSECANMIIQAGISKVVYRNEYMSQSSLVKEMENAFKAAGITVERMS